MGNKKPDENKIKKDLLAHYVKLRKDSPRKSISVRKFFRDSPHTKYQLDKIYINYLPFQDEAEKLYFSKLPKSQRALISERSKKYDPDATYDDCIVDLRAVQALTPDSFVTRTDYRKDGKYSDKTWISHFGNFTRFRQQAGLELTGNQQKLTREIAKHASINDYKLYFDEQVRPYYKKYKKNKDHKSPYRNIMIISDIHDIECDEFTLSVFIAECKRKQPDIIVLNGDVFDNPEFSRYSVDPRDYDIKKRYEFVWHRIFAPLRKHCPDTQIDFIIGNHEFRILKLLSDATPNIRILLSDIVGLKFKDFFKVDEYQINFVSKFDLSAITKRDLREQLKRNYQIYYDCFIVAHEPDPKLKTMSGTHGHHHKAEMESAACIDVSTGKAKRFVWTQTPACHVTDASYLQNLSQWNTGFLDVVINIRSKEVIQNLRQTFDEWTEIEGIVYERTKNIK